MKFYPIHKDLIQKYHIDKVKKVIIHHAKGKVLDIGCGEKPFYPFVKNQVESYIGVDHPETPHSHENIDVFANAYELPFEKESFDVALMTQVIEHLENPNAAMSEVARVLKRKGILILAWPFLYPIHEAPRDFFRYTSYGIEFLARKTGFEIEKIVPVSGFWITFIGLLSVYLYGKSKTIYFLLTPVLLALKIICQMINLLDRNQSSMNKWTWNYYAVLKKK